MAIDTNSRNEKLDRMIFVGLGSLLLVTLQFQILPLDIQVQTLPWTTVVALSALPWVVLRVPRSPLLLAMMAFAGFAITHSAIAVMTDLWSVDGDVRIFAWLRQLFALTAGVVTFLAFRICFLYLDTRRIVRLIILGSLPAIALSLINILWGGLGYGWAGDVVLGVRQAVGGDPYTSSMRATGFATEPASLSTLLVIVFVPVLLLLARDTRRRIWFYCLALATILTFVWTFSTTGFLILFIVLAGGAVLGPRRAFMTRALVGLVILIALAFVLFPNNQVLRHAAVIAVGKTNISFDDRFYGSVGPFLRFFDSFSFVGYGLGGVVTHFAEIIPEEAQAGILAVKYEGLPSLAIVSGRLMAETGLVGFLLFSVFLAVAFWELAVIKRSALTDHDTYEYSSIRLGLIAVVISLITSIGPYHTPYIWLWPAFVDSRFLLLQRRAPS